MIIKKGAPFFYNFNMKAPDGRIMNLSRANVKFVVEGGLFAREYTVGNGLRVTITTGAVDVMLSPQQTDEFSVDKLLYALIINGVKVSSGILEVEV